MIKRLRVKFVCINMTIVTVMLCVMFGTIMWFTKNNLERESIVMMRAMAVDSLSPGRPDEVFTGVRLPYFALQVGKNNELLQTNGGYYDLSDRAFLEDLLQTALSAGEQTGVLKEYGLRFCVVETPVTRHFVFADISSEVSTLNHLMKTCLGIGSLSFFAFLLVSIALSRWAVGPVAKAWKQQRQFVADASHELKTPLTVVLTNAELLQSGEYDRDACSQFTGNIVTMSWRMKELVESLLNLARVDNGAAAKVMTGVNLSELVNDTILPFEPLYFENGLELEAEVAEGVKVKGSDSYLRQALEILLDNAQKYAARQTTVLVRLEKQKHKKCLISVSNVGEEIPAEDLKHIFERFYRVDKARAINGSYGLGLAIAENIVREHKGKIWAESRNGRNTFYIQLPSVKSF